MAPTRPTYESNSDTCRYTLDLPAPHDQGDHLRSHCAHLVAVALSLTQGYIWHNKQPGFTLQPSPVDFARPATATSPQHHHLEGSTDVTDAVDDEWLVVWILKHLSLDCTDAVISVDDDDGEFLLIEAADSLPAWLTPQNAANRVWIHHGRLHLVPLEHTSPVPFAATGAARSTADEPLNPSFDPDDDAFLDRAAAILLVRDPNVDTLAPPEVEAAVWARIDGYPAKIKEHHHRTLAYLPTDIALALADDPSLIAEAVGAFYQREPITLRAVNTMSRFPPAPPLPSSSTSPASSSDMSDSTPTLPPTVLVPTLLTRPLYSQLVLQRFYAPKVFEKAGWTSGTLGKDDERRRSVGMKIACGFEMLYKQTSPLPRQSTSSSSSADLDSVDTASPAYRAYLGTLRAQGFFGEGEREEVEGSERWQEREREARRGWVRAREDRSERPFAQRVDDAISRARAALSSPSSSSSPAAPLPLSNRITSPTSLTPDAASAIEDAEDWMALDEQGLEEILATKSSATGGGAQLGDSDLEDEDEDDDDEEDDEEEERRAQGDGMEGVEGGSSAGAGAGPKGARERAEDRKARKVARRLEEMAGKVEDFVQGRGAASGALFDDERELDDSDDSDAADDDEVMPELSAEERASRMDKLVAGLPAEQWGQATAPATAASAAAVAADDDSSASAGAHGPPPLQQQAQQDQLQQREARAPKLEKEVYEGASDLSDESDSENEAMPEGEEGLGGDEVDEGEDGPSVVDEDDLLDLGEEMDEFLQFATETLGLTPAQYEKILSDRRGRGAFVPGPAKEKKTNVLPSAKKGSSSTSSSTAPPKPSPAAATAAGNPPPAHEPLRNPNLTDFDALMEQMETELARSKGARPAAAAAAAAPAEVSDDDGPAPTGKYASRQSGRREPHRVVVDSLSDSDEGDEDGDDLSAMDAELASLLQGVSGDAAGTDAPMDYNLVKNFLESFQSQGGFAGPAGTLAGRLGFPLPRDAPGEGEGGSR